MIFFFFLGGLKKKLLEFFVKSFIKICLRKFGSLGVDDIVKGQPLFFLVEVHTLEIIGFISMGDLFI